MLPPYIHIHQTDIHSWLRQLHQFTLSNIQKPLSRDLKGQPRFVNPPYRYTQSADRRELEKFYQQDMTVITNDFWHFQKWLSKEAEEHSGLSQWLIVIATPTSSFDLIFEGLFAVDVTLTCRWVRGYQLLARVTCVCGLLIYTGVVHTSSVILQVDLKCR